MRLPKLNQAQIKAAANLLIDVGKWIIVSIVLTTVFNQNASSKKISDLTLALAFVLALTLITYGIRSLKGVKEK